MSITAERKQTLIGEYATKSGDTGSPEVQVAILSERIRNLTEHLGTHAKDFHSRRGLLVMVGQRRALLDYLKKKKAQRHQSLINRPGLRRCNGAAPGEIGSPGRIAILRPICARRCDGAGPCDRRRVGVL